MQFKYQLSSCKEYDYKQYVLDQDYLVIRFNRHVNTTLLAEEFEISSIFLLLVSESNWQRNDY